MIYGQPVTFGGKKAEGEIPITANGIYDVAEYASANVNVQSAPVLLWTNASPTSDFNPQTINVSGAGFDAYLVEIKVAKHTHTAYRNTVIGYIRKNYTLSQTYLVYGDSGYTGQRNVSSATDTAITFGSGTNGYNEMGIPLYVWGVKFTL